MSTGGDVKLAANLAVLQRMDPSISEVLCNAAHVTLYLFSEETSTWQKLNVEGSLFVVRRAREPHHQYIVMNRRSADNYVEDISSPKFAIQDADPYLMYRNQTDQIVGIWFYDAAERVVVAKLLREITDAYKQLATKPPLAQPQPQPAPQGPVKIDLATLMKAASAASSSIVTSVAVPPTAPTTAPAPAPAPTATSSAARERLRARLRVLIEDDAFVDSIGRILAATESPAAQRK